LSLSARVSCSFIWWAEKLKTTTRGDVCFISSFRDWVKFIYIFIYLFVCLCVFFVCVWRLVCSIVKVRKQVEVAP
jgi:hypothetical protein